MSHNVVPLRLRPHLVSFLMKEMKGDVVSYGSHRVKAVDVPKKSFLGKYVVDHLEKIDYPVKDIHHFNFYLQVKQTTRRKFFVSGKVFKVEKIGRSFVFLPELYAKTLNDLFEQQFRTAFYNFVEARSQGDDLLISQSILDFIDKYDLFECEVSQPQLRRLYYRLKQNGLCAAMHGKLYRD